MPVFKFKSYDAAAQALWNFNPDVEYYRRIHELYIMAEKLNKFKCDRGVFKFRTASDAQSWREEAELRLGIEKAKGKS